MSSEATAPVKLADGAPYGPAPSITAIASRT